MKYEEYLKVLHTRASAAYRKRMRKHPESCAICGQKNAEITPEGIWLCTMHNADFKNLQPVRSIEDKLRQLGASFPTREEFELGDYKIKKRKPPEPVCKFKPLKYNGTGKTMR